MVSESDTRGEDELLSWVIFDAYVYGLVAPEVWEFEAEGPYGLYEEIADAERLRYSLFVVRGVRE